MAIMNKEKDSENKRVKEIDDSEEDEESENQKMEMFFNLIRNYQEARKRRRTPESGDDAASIPTKRYKGGEKSGIVPVFRAEDFFYCMGLNLKSSISIIPSKNQVEDIEEEEAEKEIREDSGLDLNLAL